MATTVIYDGKELGPHFIVNIKSKSILPPQQVTSIQVPARAGGWFSRKKHGIRAIEVAVTITADSVADLHQKADELAEIFSVDEPKKLVITDQPDRYYLAILHGSVEEDRKALFMINQLNFVCFDPYAYSSVPNVYQHGQVYNQGTAPAHPIITATLTEASSDLVINHLTTGKIMRVIRDFVAGDVVVINCETGKVTVNGSLAVADLDLNTLDFFKLERGHHDFTVTPATTQVEIELIKRWL